VSVRDRWERDVRFRFLAIGAYNTAFGYVLWPVLYWLLGTRLHYAIVYLIAHVIAVINAFVAYRRFTFRAEEGSWPRQFLRFNVGYLGALAIGLGGMAVLVDRVHLSPFVAQPILLTITVVLSFLWHSRVSFRASPK
jgi:putative flippase GtrA